MMKDYKYSPDESYKYEVKVNYKVGNGETRTDILYFKEEKIAKTFTLKNNNPFKQAIYRGELSKIMEE